MIYTVVPLRAGWFERLVNPLDNPRLLAAIERGPKRREEQSKENDDDYPRASQDARP